MLDTAPSRRLLGLPMWEPRLTLAATVGLAIYYLVTMHRGLSLYDSPELAMVAEQLGLGHPIGQPLHTMLGWIVSRIGPNPLVALNALSALVGALTVIPAVSLVDAFRREAPQGLLDRAAGPVAVAIVGLHPLLWEPATRIEAYPLAVWLSLWTAARVQHGLASGSAPSQWYAAAGFCLGLAATANAYCALGTAIALTPRVVLALRERQIRPLAIATSAAAGLVGLLPFLYVPLVARRSGAVIWGKPDTYNSLIHYITGRDFARARELTMDVFLSNVRVLGEWAFSQWIVALFLLGGLGFAAYSKRGQLGGVFFAASVLFFGGLIVSNAIFVPDVLDHLGYLSVPGWISACGVGLLVSYAARQSRGTLAVVAVAVALVVLWSKPVPWRRTRHLDHVTESIAIGALRSAPPEAILVVQSDHWAGPLWYLQEQRNLRPDVTVLAYGLTSSSWYWDIVFARHPDLKRVPLRGGNRNARVRRFLEANSTRPVVVERVSLAEALGLTVCVGEWLWNVAPDCPPVGEPAILGVIAQQRERLGRGSPGTDGLLAELAFEQGYGLVLSGRPRVAVLALVSAVPTALRPSVSELAALPEVSEQSPVAPPSRNIRVSFGELARNLDYASRIAASHQASELASRFARQATELRDAPARAAK